MGGTASLGGNRTQLLGDQFPRWSHRGHSTEPAPGAQNELQHRELWSLRWRLREPIGFMAILVGGQAEGEVEESIGVDTVERYPNKRSAALDSS